MPRATNVTMPSMITESGSMIIPHFSCAGPASSHAMLKDSLSWPSRSMRTNQKRANPSSAANGARKAPWRGRTRPTVTMTAKAMALRAGISHAQAISGIDDAHATGVGSDHHFIRSTSSTFAVPRLR